MSNNPIYLSLDGKVTGPYTAGQIMDLRQSGELYNYSWIWESKEKGWTAIEEEVEIPASMPVPPPPDAAYAPEPVRSRERTSVAIPSNQENMSGPPSTQSPPNSDILQGMLRTIHVICHNRKTVMNGRLDDASEAGCTLQSLLPVQDLPTFKIGTQVSINLLNPVSGSSENTSATIKAARRGEQFWQYELQWSSLPKILESGG